MKKAVISFTHTNYCIRSAGTEKFVRNISRKLELEGYSHLNFFSFYDDKHRMKKKLVGVNYNDHFWGIYKYEDISKVIDTFSFKYELVYTSVQIHHILHHDLDYLSQIINYLNIPTYYFVHDYYMVCNSINMIDSNNNFCGVSVPCYEKCKSCLYRKAAEKHYSDMQDFFYSISNQIKYIITPSNYVTSHIQNIYSEYKNKIITRPHLILYGSSEIQPIIDRRINIAFAGVQNNIKGYPYWEKLVNELGTSTNYKFYYFGNGKKENSCVKNVYVSSAEQGDDAMIQAMKHNNIDIVFLWPNWPETYSYVYYEMAVSGVFILTNTISGNIADETANNENGIVFNSFNDCIEWLRNEKMVKGILDNYKTLGKYRPYSFRDNDDLSCIVSNDRHYKAKCSSKVHRKIETYFYKFKYRNSIGVRT